MRFVYLHGFASGPTSRKACFFAEKFREAGLTLEVPELTPAEAEGGFEALTLSGQLRLLDGLIGGEPCILMGSSMGGYLSAIYAARHAEVQRIVILAPAFCMARRWHEAWGPERMEEWRTQGYAEVFHYAKQRDERIGYQLMEDAALYPDYPEVTQPALVFHGREDAIVPVEFAREFTGRSPNARLVEFDSDHELTDCMEQMWDETKGFLPQLNGGG